LNEDGTQLRTDIVDPRDFAFGYGRRICPGRHFAEESLWMVFTVLLSNFKISTPVDNEGRKTKPDLTPDYQFIINSPKPFECNFVPRSTATEELLRSASL